MSDKGFKVKNGLTIQGTTDTLITADNSGGILIGGVALSSYSAPTLGSTSIASGATVETISDLTLSNPTINLTTSINVPCDSGIIYGNSYIGTPFVVFFTSVNAALGSLSVGDTITLPADLATSIGPAEGAGQTFTISSLTDPTGFNEAGLVGYTIADPNNYLLNAFNGGGGTSILAGDPVIVSASENSTGKVLKSTGTGVEWITVTPEPTHKEVFFLSDGYYSHWSVDGLSWTNTANPGSQDLYNKLNQPGGIASSGSRTVLVNIDSYASNPSGLAFEVNENFYSPTLKSNISSFTMGNLISQFPNFANWGIYGDNPAIKGVASNGNGTFVISFLRTLNVLVSTDNASTWQQVSIPTPPAGENGEGEGGQKPYWKYPTYQFGKFYVTSFGDSSFIESSDGLTWTTVTVPFGMPYSSLSQVYVDAVGNLIAAYDQAAGLVYRPAGSSSFSTSSNGLIGNNPERIRIVGTSFYGTNNQSIQYANFRNDSPSESYNRRVYTNSEISSSPNLITQTTSEVLYGSYSFMDNQHPMGRIGVYGAHKPFAASLDTQSDLRGFARSLYIPIALYKKVIGE